MAATLEVLEREELELFGRMALEIQTLGEKMKKVKAEGCQEAFRKVSKLFTSMSTNRLVLRKARAQNKASLTAKMQSVGADANKLTSAIEGVVKVSQDTASSMLETIQNVSEEIKNIARGPRQSAENATRVDSFDEHKWTEVAKRRHKPNPAGAEPSWTEVVKKPRKNRNKEADAAPTMETPTQPRTVLRSRPPAIMVDVSREKFPELAKKIRGSANRDVLEDHVVGMRQAKAGGIIIGVRGISSEVEALRAEIAKVAGNEIGVRSLEQRAVIEVRDLDE